MSKRRATSSTNSVAGSSTTRTKRIKFNNFAAANDTDDLPHAHFAGAQQQERQSSSSGISTRPSPRAATFPSLASLSARVFATNFKTLYIPEDHTNPNHGIAMRNNLKMLPDTLIPKLLALLREHCPTYLTHGLLVMVCLESHVVQATI